MAGVLEDILQLLTSIASELDVMLNDLCRTFPISSPALTTRCSPNCTTPPLHTLQDYTGHQTTHIRESSVLEQYISTARSLDDNVQEEENDSCSTDFGDKTGSASSSEAEFFSVDEDQSSDAAVAGSESDDSFSPTPPDTDDPGGSCGAWEKQRHIPLLERLIRTHPIWYLPNISRSAAIHLLHNREEGTFLVRQASTRDMMALTVRHGLKPHLEHYLLESTGKGIRLQGALCYYQGVPLLIAHYCEHRDGLPTQLVLPYAVRAARTHQELASLSLLGQDFWTSPVAELRPVLRTVYHTTVQAYQPTFTPSSMKPVTNGAIPGCAFKHTKMVNSKLDSSRNDFKTVSGQAATLPKPQNRVDSSHKDFPECNGAMRSGSEGTLCSGHGGDLHIPKNASNLSLTNHSRDRSAFQTPPLRVDSWGRVNGVQLMNGINEAEESFTPTHFFRPIHCESRIKHDSSPDKSMKKEQNRLSSHNLAYNSDCTSESDFIDHGFMVDVGKKSTERAIETKTMPVEQSVPQSLPKQFEPVVFTFDLKLPKPAESNMNKSPRTMISEVCHQVEGVNTDVSSCSQYSSPAYVEPYDSLIGRVEGVTHTTGVVKVNNILRQGNEAREETEAAPFRVSHAPPRRSESQKTSKPVRDRSLPRSFHTMPCTAVWDKPPPSPNKHGNQSLPPWRRSRDSYPAGPQASKVHTESKPLLGSYGRSQSLRSLSPGREIQTRQQRDYSRARSLPKEVPDLVRTKHPVVPPTQTVVEPPVLTSSPRITPGPKLMSPIIPKSLEDDLEAVIASLEEAPRPSLNKFPVYRSHASLYSNQTSFSDTTTVEDLISNDSPELTLKPIKPLTVRNLQRMSDYDNLHMHGPGSRRTVASSVGTHYSQPWDSTPWQDLLSATHFPAKPCLSSPLSKHAQSSPEIFRDAAEKLEQAHAHEKEETPSEAEYSSVYCGSESARALSEIFGSERAVSFEYHSPRESAFMSGGIEPDDVPNGVPVSDDEGVEDDHDNAGDNLMSILAPPRRVGMRAKGPAPGSKVREFISNLAQRRDTTFGITVSNFIKCTIEGSESNPHIVLRNVRQFMNGIKNYLVQHGEDQLTTLIEEERSKLGSTEFLNIDALIEGALHKCVIKPLKQHMYQLFVQEYKKNGNLQQLSDNIKYARTKSPYEMGIRSSIIPPQSQSMETIKHFLDKMQKAYSPLKKLENLLGATSSIYNSVAQGSDDGVSDSSSKGSVGMGSDDFLPMFIYVLVQCGMIGAEIEADYMWGLLHPCLLAGEGGYHLTTLSSAVHVLRNLRSTMEATSDCPRLPSLGDLHGFMKVIIPDEKHDSIITKTLPVRPTMTTKEACNMIAHKFKITNPQDYGLYVLVSGVEDRLADTACPQSVKDEITADNRECIFAYKRINAKFAWPISFRRH